MLSFIGMGSTAAVVLCDLASTAYYIGGVVESQIGKAAPWYILAVMLFSYAVRSVYISTTDRHKTGLIPVAQGLNITMQQSRDGAPVPFAFPLGRTGKRETARPRCDREGDPGDCSPPSWASRSWRASPRPRWPERNKGSATTLKGSNSSRKPSSRVGLIKDLKVRGLSDDTLVIWGGEFGRRWG